MAQNHRLAKRAPSTESSANNDTTSSEESGTASSLPTSPLPRPPGGKRVRDASNTSSAPDKDKRKSKKARTSGPVRGKQKAHTTKRTSRHKTLTPQEHCIHVARWIPRGLDMFCDLNEVIRVCLLLEDEEDADTTEDEQSSNARRKILDNIDDHTRLRYKRTFKYVMENAPYLRSLIGRKKKREELMQLISMMQNMINHTRSEDACRLKSRISSYAAPHPDKEVVHPPISDDSKSRARMGFNHPQLAAMLCPVKYLVDYLEDPNETRKQIQSGSLKVTGALWPAFLYPGDTPGKDFDPEDIIEGLFRGYLVERILKHIFTSPSSALSSGVSNGTRRPCNAKIHAMFEVEAEHIAYAAIQARFAISSLDKWKDKDGLFNYTDFYYRITRLIRERKDGEWVDSLLGYYNEKLFGNEKGAEKMHAENVECSENDDMVAMNRQLAARAARASRSSDPPRSSMRSQSSPVAERQESPGNSYLPLPNRSPTPEPPLAHAPNDAPKDTPLVPPATPLGPDNVDLYARKRKRQIAASPERSPTPESPVRSHRHKRVVQPLDNIFDDDGPLTEDEEEVAQPAKRMRKDRGAQPKNPTRRSGRVSRK